MVTSKEDIVQRIDFLKEEIAEMKAEYDAKADALRDYIDDEENELSAIVLSINEVVDEIEDLRGGLV